ncbi:hypothetical protein [Gemmobacter sp.]|uniref:hypothetical protein n=1 Tax=Gemmobacter sp. TaxID=1898957 RepID=UPI002AFF6C94|nr:hypothetical protein [Gemmobacter sp.]
MELSVWFGGAPVRDRPPAIFVAVDVGIGRPASDANTGLFAMIVVLLVSPLGSASG